MELYLARRRRNRIATGFALAATAFGLGWLVVILVALLWNGVSGLSTQVFTQMTPPPGSDGGLLNPIIGSLILTSLAVLMGTPIARSVFCAGRSSRDAAISRRFGRSPSQFTAGERGCCKDLP